MLSPEAPRSRGNRSDASFCAARGEHGKPRTGNRCGKRRGTPTHDCPTWRSALVRLRGRSGVMCGAQTNCVPGVAERVILWLAAELSFGGSPRADAPPGFPRQPVDSQTRRQDAGDQCGRRPQPRPSTVSIPALPERDSVDPRLGRVVRPLRVRSVSRPAVRPNDNTKPISAPGLCPRRAEMFDDRRINPMGYSSFTARSRGEARGCDRASTPIEASPISAASASCSNSDSVVAHSAIASAASDCPGALK